MGAAFEERVGGVFIFQGLFRFAWSRLCSKSTITVWLTPNTFLSTQLVSDVRTLRADSWKGTQGVLTPPVFNLFAPKAAGTPENAPVNVSIWRIHGEHPTKLPLRCIAVDITLCLISFRGYPL